MDTKLLRDETPELRGELKEQIYKFNVQATGIADGLLLRLAYRNGDELLSR